MNTIGWGNAVNNLSGFGEQGDEYLRNSESYELRLTEDGSMRVTEGVDSSGFAEVYNRTWWGDTNVER